MSIPNSSPKNMVMRNSFWSFGFILAILWSCLMILYDFCPQMWAFLWYNQRPLIGAPVSPKGCCAGRLCPVIWSRRVHPPICPPRAPLFWAPFWRSIFPSYIYVHNIHIYIEYIQKIISNSYSIDLAAFHTLKWEFHGVSMTGIEWGRSPRAESWKIPGLLRRLLGVFRSRRWRWPGTVSRILCF